jgi:orotidine-5'-phosphate decarboxylase
MARAPCRPLGLLWVLLSVDLKLSQKQISTTDRLIVALDVPTVQDAKELVNLLGDSVHFYKIGLELFMAGDYFELLDWLNKRNKKVFVDLKFFDIPETVRRAVQRLNGRNVHFATVHGNDSIMQAAAEAKGDVRILAVTVLTSLDRGDLDDLGFDCDIEELVLSRARRAVAAGCDGVVASGLEAVALKKALDDRLLIVSPGIRPVENREDQKRVVGVEQAFRNGADYIVVGRPIRNAEDPKAVAEQMQAQIAGVFNQ